MGFVEEAVPPWTHRPARQAALDPVMACFAITSPSRHLAEIPSGLSRRVHSDALGTQFGWFSAALPAKRLFVDPHTMHDNGELAGNGYTGYAKPAFPGDLHAQALIADHFFDEPNRTVAA
jgi:hypothetical protein